MQLHVQTSVDMKIISVPPVRALRHASCTDSRLRSTARRHYIIPRSDPKTTGEQSVCCRRSNCLEQSATHSTRVPKSAKNMHLAITTWCFLSVKFSCVTSSLSVNYTYHYCNRCLWLIGVTLSSVTRLRNGRWATWHDWQRVVSVTLSERSINVRQHKTCSLIRLQSSIRRLATTIAISGIGSECILASCNVH